MKILLSYLSDSNDSRDLTTAILPTGMFSLAASLEKRGHHVIVANFSHTGTKKALQIIGDTAPDIAAFSILTHNRNDTVKLIKECKDAYPNMTTVAGGSFSSAMSGELARRYPEIDYIIEDDGVSALDTLAVKGKGFLKPSRILHGKKSSSIEYVSAVEFGGVMKGVNPNEQFKQIAASRIPLEYDPFSCGINFWGSNLFVKTPLQVAEEMKFAHDKYGIIFFDITDEVFCSDEKSMSEFCTEISAKECFPMWSAVMRPESITENLIMTMKKAGCERICIPAWSGSQKLLDEINPSITVEIIQKACDIMRNIGVYTSLILRTGLYDEKKSDVAKTIALIRKCLPGDGTVLPAVYHPGSLVYKKAVESQRLDPAVFFEQKGKGIYLRNNHEIRGWIEQLRTELKVIRQKSWYKEKDFRNHRKNGAVCWVTDILEGDLFLDEERDNNAEQCYMNVVSKYSRNPWGYLRMGKLSFGRAQFDAAETHFGKVTEIVPQYYGGWLKLAESVVAQGRRKEGKDLAQKALELNKWDVRISRLLENI
jgi:anaerobic magnesium-protoporphyrin IX monomethyl ester cyclase